MLTYMNVHRTTLILPEALDARLRQEAARRGMTVSELTREAIAAHLDVPGSDTDDASVRPRRRLASTASGASGRADISERIEELLRQDFGRTDFRRTDLRRDT